MQNKSKTIVIVSPGFAADENDSTCLPAQQSFVLSLKNLYPHLQIIVLAFQYPFFSSTYFWNDITVISFNGRNRGKLYRRRLWQKVRMQLVKLYSQYELIGLISFWYGECAFVAEQFSRKYFIKHYCWILGQDARTGNRFVSKTNLNADQLIAMSDFLADEFQKNYSVSPKYVIPNAINYHNENLFSERNIDVIGVGSLIPLKQFNLFLDCIYQLKKILPDIKAVICGKGKEENKLCKQGIHLGLQENIFFLGELSHKEVLQLMSRSKILLHPSSYEGFSGVCLEALSCGTQVISFCKAMNVEIEGWHIVSTLQEMIEKLKQLLLQDGWNYQPVIPYTVDDSTKKMMELFVKQPVTHVENLI